MGSPLIRGGVPRIPPQASIKEELILPEASYKVDKIKLNHQRQGVGELSAVVLQDLNKVMQELTQYLENRADLKKVKVVYRPKTEQLEIVTYTTEGICSKKIENWTKLNPLSNHLAGFKKSYGEHIQEQVLKERPDVTKADPTGQIFQESFQDQGVDYGQQTITRMNVVEADYEFSRKQIAELKKQKTKLQQQPTLKDRQAKIAIVNKQIQYYVSKIGNINAHTVKTREKSWIGANYFRNLIKKFDSYAMAVQAYTAIPVNMRWQEYELNGQKKGFYRVGVMTDLSNGWINLQWLKNLQSLPSKEQQSAIDLKIKEIETKLKKRENKGLKRLFVGDGVKPLMKEGANYALAHLKEMKSRPTTISDFLLERRLRVRDQFMHLLQQQVRANEDHFPNEVLELAHVGLLNPKKSKLNATGWMHQEQNELIDMQEMFEEFDQAKVILDQTGPFIDAEGKIHLSHTQENEGKELTLRTYFFNISVQGQKHTGLQKEICDKAIAKLAPDRQNDPNFQRLKTRLDKGESNHDVAEDLMFLLMNWEIKVSTGCLSVKDRTKIVSENVIRKFMGEAFSQAKHQKAMQKFRDKAFTDLNNPSSKVINDNTPGVWVPKFHLFWIKSKISFFAKIIFAKQALMTHVIKPVLHLGTSTD